MKMNRNADAAIVKKLTLATSRANQAEMRLMQSPAALKDRKTKEDLVKTILTAMEGAESIEELLHIERTLQTLDKKKAVTAQDQTGIENAEREYAQIAETTDQMRRAPGEYLKANRSMKETGGDAKKMPRSRGLQQIAGNRARLRNRSSFSDENNRMVWDARIALADKTADMLTALHNGLAGNVEE